jgi:hypothetical protein
MSKIKNIVKLPPKLRIISTVSAVFGLVLTVCLLTPLDLYIHNAVDYQIGFTTEFFPLLICAIAVSALLSAVLLALPDKARTAVILIFWGLTAAAYIQALFLNGEMVTITGDSTDYASYTPAHIINFILFVAITVAPLLIAKGFGDKGKVFAFDKPLIFTAVLICGMQIAGIVSTAVTASYPADYQNAPKHLAYGPTLEVGGIQNITVFLLDRLDVRYVKEALEENPELYEQLDGFTFYENNISEYTNTFPSVTTMLTGNYYEVGETYTE